MLPPNFSGSRAVNLSKAIEMGGFMTGQLPHPWPQ
jgi:hypothetical protein